MIVIVTMIGSSEKHSLVRVWMLLNSTVREEICNDNFFDSFWVCVYAMLVGIGTELLNEIQQVMREDKEKAVQDAVSSPLQVHRHLSSHSQFFHCSRALKTKRKKGFFSFLIIFGCCKMTWWFFLLENWPTHSPSPNCSVNCCSCHLYRAFQTPLPFYCRAVNKFWSRRHQWESRW